MVHRQATVAKSAPLAPGAQVLARGRYSPLAVVGENSIAERAAVIEHDAPIGAHVHISPGCVLAGEVLDCGSGARRGRRCRDPAG